MSELSDDKGSVFENVWATRLRDPIVKSNGIVLDNARTPAAIVQAALEAAGKPVS